MFFFLFDIVARQPWGAHRGRCGASAPCRPVETSQSGAARRTVRTCDAPLVPAPLCGDSSEGVLPAAMAGGGRAVLAVLALLGATGALATARVTAKHRGYVDKCRRHCITQVSLDSSPSFRWMNGFVYM